MKLTNLIRITNTTSYHIVMWPKRKVHQDKIAIFIASHSDKKLDLVESGVVLDLDAFYFQFQGERKKIRIDDLKLYGITLEYDLL